MIIYTLGEIGDKNAVIPLIANYEDENDEMRKITIYSLGEIGSRDALEFMRLALNEENETIVLELSKLWVKSPTQIVLRN